MECCFSDLKLTTKGEQTAIQERKRVAEFKELLPEIIKQAQNVVEEMDKSEEPVLAKEDNRSDDVFPCYDLRADRPNIVSPNPTYQMH